MWLVFTIIGIAFVFIFGVLGVGPNIPVIMNKDLFNEVITQVVDQAHDDNKLLLQINKINKKKMTLENYVAKWYIKRVIILGILALSGAILVIVGALFYKGFIYF